ncbi:MAG TPA: YdeI/OmpD-associated family protein, partial [Rubellimicrobium sp.]|nr:YdeI/OmpD-associated family protein [Rubellimicrobium sp.]
HAGCHIAILGVVRSDVRLGFFHAALLTDPEGILERQGPNTRHPDMIGFHDDGDVRNKKLVILATLREAMGYAEQGLEPPLEVGSPNLPDEAIEALDAAQLAEALHGLTPGRQRSYFIALGSAKTSVTRAARVVTFRDHIMTGKGAQER